jgi:Flp pilus assembly protein TadG
MISRSATFSRCELGATAVEFSLILLPLLLLTLGIIEFGRLMWYREALQQTAIASARCVGMLQTNCTAAGVYNASNSTSFVQTTAASWGITLPTSGVTVNTSATCGGVTGFSQVSLTYTFQTVMPGLLPMLAGGSMITAAACFPTS